MEPVVRGAVADARTLAEAGFDALMVENFGDAPFYADAVPPVTVASMARVLTEIGNAVSLPAGVNVLRNDGVSALSIAAAVGAPMVRINVLSGSMFTDQGLISGRAAEIGRLRAALAPDVLVLADVHVKHAVPPPGSSIDRSAADLWERGGADALVVSGSGTGGAIDLVEARAVREAVDAPIVVGSGATGDTVDDLAKVADSVIVGSALKRDGDTALPVDADLAGRFVDAARQAGFTG